jgi:hypothetical protein
VCGVLFGRVVLFHVTLAICVLCVIVMQLPTGKTPFAVKINNKSKK